VYFCVLCLIVVPLPPGNNPIIKIRKKLSGLENQEYCLRDVPHPQKLALTFPTSGRSVGIVRSPTKATEFSLVLEEKNCTYFGL
jgi:hypothetical protein